MFLAESLFQLKFCAKQLDRLSKKAEKEQRANEKKVIFHLGKKKLPRLLEEQEITLFVWSVAGVVITYAWICSSGAAGPGEGEPRDRSNLRRECRPQEEREPQLPANVGQSGRCCVEGEVGSSNERRLQEHGLRRQKSRQGKMAHDCFRLFNGELCICLRILICCQLSHSIWIIRAKVNWPP